MGRLHRACTSGEGLGSLQQETGRCLKFTLDSLLLGDRKEKKGQKGGEQLWGHASGQVTGAGGLDLPGRRGSREDGEVDE